MSGNPHKAAGGGCIGAGIDEMSDGGVGVTGQSAMYFGSPWHPLQSTPSAARLTTNRIDRNVGLRRLLNDAPCLANILAPGL